MDRGKRKGKSKVDKPLAERKRRARINDALLQLKSIVLQSIKNESTMMSKLEKADILEMTVEYIHKLQHLQTKAPDDGQLTVGANSIVFDDSQYTSGFNECTSHVAECISALPDTDVSNDNIKTRLLEHLVSVASTSDFRNKSKQQDTVFCERNSNVDGNAISTSENSYYAYASPVSQNSVPENEYTLCANSTSELESSSVECLKPETEISRSLCGDSTYTNLDNGLCNANNYQYPMYTAFYNGLFSLQGGSFTESLSNEERVSNTTFLLLPAEVPNVQGMNTGAYTTVLDDEHNNVESYIHTKDKMIITEGSDAVANEIPYAIESGMLSMPYREYDSKTVLQTQEPQVQLMENDADTNKLSGVTTDTKDEQAVHSSIPVTGNSGSVVKVDNIVSTNVADKKSAIMNIPKKRRVFGDFTNTGNSNRTNNIKSPTKTSLNCEKELIPHIRSPNKSKNKSPLKESRRIPKPIKKRISASVFERENKTCNHDIENAEAKLLFPYADNQYVSTTHMPGRLDGNHVVCKLNDINCKSRGECSDSRVHVDGSNVTYCQDDRTEQNASAAQDNLNTIFPHNGNKLPPINSFKELISSKYPNRHCSQNLLRNLDIPKMDHSGNNDFYQHFFAQNSSGNVWRPW